MQFDASQLITRRILAWLGGVLVLLLCFPTLFHLVFSSQQEVSVETDIGITTCLGVFLNEPGDVDSCVTDYRVVIGNTGTMVQSRVTVRLSPPPDPVRFSSSVVAIIASARSAPPPVISQQVEPDTLSIHIDNLHPNRLVEIHLSTRSLEAYRQLQTMAATVTADGTVIATNPHVTVLARFVRTVYSLFGA